MCNLIIMWVRLIILSNLIALPAMGQWKVLHYTETSGYDHQTRAVSLAMFQDLGAQLNFIVDDDTDGSTFDLLSDLQQYAVIVFSNTSGDAILDPMQRANFEAYINGGGSVLGIHAASDTYRHSSANGNNTGSWDFYAELMGASVQENPNHVNGTPLYALQHIGAHPSTAALPDPWNKNEEYYYWENGYYDPSNLPVLEVEETVGPNGMVNSYDAARPMSWYRDLLTGGRVFYTALGHAQSNFTTDSLFRAHIRDALLWAAFFSTSIAEQERSAWRLWPSIGEGTIWISADVPFERATIMDLHGRPVMQVILSGERTEVVLGHLAAGSYLLVPGSLAFKPLPFQIQR